MPYAQNVSEWSRNASGTNMSARATDFDRNGLKNDDFNLLTV